MTLDTALKSAADFDPWDLVETDHELPHLPPDMFTAPTRPPEDSAFAPLPGADHATPPPWFRDVNRGESTAQHNAFRHYLALGPQRTLRAAAEEMDASYKSISNLAKTFDWATRATAFDAYTDEQYEKTLLARVRSMAERHATIFSNALSGLSVAFKPLLENEYLADELSALSAKDRLRLATQAAKAMPALAAAERLALGMPTEITEKHETKVVRAEMSLDDLKGVLGGLMEAGVLEKESSLAREKAEIIDVEVVEDGE